MNRFISHSGTTTEDEDLAATLKTLAGSPSVFILKKLTLIAINHRQFKSH